MNPSRTRIVSVLLVCSHVPTAGAAVLEWSGSTTGLATGTSNTWNTNTTANWWNGSSLVNWPALGGTDDDAVFGGTAGTVTITTATANDITINSIGYLLSGGTLTLNGTTPTITTGTSISATISSVIAGSAGLNKSGAGTLTLSGTNNYTGATTISAGTVVVQNSAAFGANGNNITVNSGAALDLGGTLASNGLNQGTRVFTVSGSGVGGTGVLTSTATNSQINAISKVVLAGNATFGGSQRWDIRGNTPTLNLAGFTLTKTGANYLALVGVAVTPGAGNIIINQGELNVSTSTSLGGSASNSISVNNGGTLGMYQSSGTHTWTLNLNTGSTLRGENGTTVQNHWAGAVNANGSFTLLAENTHNVTISGGITGTGNLTKTGTGTGFLTGDNSSWSGGITISAGSLQVNSASSLGTGTTITTSGSNNAALVLGNGVTSGSGKSLTIAGGGAGGFFGSLSTTGTATWQGNVLIGAATGARVGTTGTTGALTISGDISENVGTPSELIIRTNGDAAAVVLSGNNSYTGGTQLATGTLQLGSANAIGTGTGNLTIGISSATTTLSSNGSTGRTIANNVVFANNSILGDATNNGRLTFTGTTSLGGATRTLTVASTVEFSNTISATGTFGITKAGAGDLILSGNNSYAGDTTITAGRVIVGHVNALGATTGKTRIDAGTLELATDSSIAAEFFDMGSGNTGTIVVNRATTGAGITHSMGNSTLGNATLNVQAGSNVTSGNAMFGLGNINLSAGSAGTLTLNPTTAGILITGGVSSGSNLAKTLGLAGSNANNLISGVIANGTNVVSVLKTGSSTWELSNANTYTGSTTVSNGTLTLSGNRTATTGAITVGNTAGQTGILEIKGDLPVGGSEFGVGATAANATGIVNHSAGLVTFTGGNALLIGRTTGNVSGTYNLSGGELKTFTSTSRGVMIGVNDGTAGNLINATFNLSGTGFLNNATGSLQVVRGDATASYQNSTYNQTGGTSTNAHLVIGGGIDGAGNLNAARGANSIATFTITGGTFSTTNFNGLSRANNVTSTMTIGGNADVTLPAFPTVRGSGSTATLYFDGGTLRPSASSSAYLGGLNNAYINNGGARFDTGTFDITVSQALLAGTGSGGLTKDGSGTLDLTSTSTYIGATVVNAGTLAVNGDISTSTTTVNNGGTLAGAGVTGSVSIANGGTLAPGNSAGTLTIDGNLGLNESSNLLFEFNPLDTAIGGGINDLVSVGGNLTLNGLLTVTATSGSFDAVTSGSWRLFNYSGTLVNNGLTLTSLPSLATGYSWDLDTATAGQVSLVILPEPGAALMGGIGLLLTLRRRRN
jgi:autotransporter-associated beta strand protein